VLDHVEPVADVFTPWKDAPQLAAGFFPGGAGGILPPPACGALDPTGGTEFTDFARQFSCEFVQFVQMDGIPQPLHTPSPERCEPLPPFQSPRGARYSGRMASTQSARNPGGIPRSRPRTSAGSWPRCPSRIVSARVNAPACRYGRPALSVSARPARQALSCSNAHRGHRQRWPCQTLAMSAPDSSTPGASAQRSPAACSSAHTALQLAAQHTQHGRTGARRLFLCTTSLARSPRTHSALGEPITIHPDLRPPGSGPGSLCSGCGGPAPSSPPPRAPPRRAPRARR
jgi:hypothetical protein